MRAGYSAAKEHILRGADAVGESGRPPPGASISRERGTPRGRRPRARTDTPRAGTGRSRVYPRPMGSRDASGSRRTYADDERPREVGQPRSTCEVRRTTPGNRRRRGWREGGWPKETCASKTRPGHRAGTARPVRWSGYVKQQDGIRKMRFTALLHHVYDVDRLRAAYLALKKRSRAGRGRRDVAALRRGAGGQPPGPVRTAETRGVPSEAGSSGVHPEGRRAAATARRARAGGQDRPARHGRGAERHLRDGLPRLLVRVPAGAQPASRAGCALRRDC